MQRAVPVPQKAAACRWPSSATIAPARSATPMRMLVSVASALSNGSSQTIEGTTPSWAFQTLFCELGGFKVADFIDAQVAVERNYCPGPFSNPNAHAGERDFSFEQWQPPDYRGHYVQLGPQETRGSEASESLTSSLRRWRSSATTARARSATPMHMLATGTSALSSPQTAEGTTPSWAF